MKRNIPILFILLAGLVTGCQSDDIGQQREEVQLQVIMAGELPATRVGVDDGKTPNIGDTFRFFFNSSEPTDGAVNTEGDDEVPKITDYTYDNDKKWGTTHPIYWDDQQNISIRRFCAIMPFSSNTATSRTFTVRSDQSATNNDSTAYKASDLLIARILTSSRLIPLCFHHVLAKVNVKVVIPVNDTDDNQYNDRLNSNVTITDVSLNNIKPVANITYGNDLTSISTPAEAANADIKVTTAASGAAVAVNMLCTKAQATANKEVTATHTAIVPPQDIAAGDLAITFSLNVDGVDKQYYFKYNKSLIAYEQGKATTLTITLSKSQVVLDNIHITSWGKIKADGGIIELPK